jgi:hypothetical protein
LQLTNGAIGFEGIERLTLKAICLVREEPVGKTVPGWVLGDPLLAASFPHLPTFLCRLCDEECLLEEEVKWSSLVL